MPKPLSRTAARRQAHRESNLYRLPLAPLGRGWALRAPGLPASLRGPFTFGHARRELAAWRANRVRELMQA
jgi:hypothetical protein